MDTQGDSFFAAFARAPDAVAAAAEAQQAPAVHAWPDGAEVRVRMGLHTEIAQVAGARYVGLDVHRAARIAAAGHGGQVLLSEATRALTEAALPDDALLRYLGEHRLKDLLRPEHLFALALPGLPADFPPLMTLDWHLNNLPVQPTPLVGREREVAVCALLQREDMRLVTLTGPGGVGKTRLGLQVAAELADMFADGAWFVRLARLTDPALVLPTIAQTLGLREMGSAPIVEILREYLRTRRLLLLLDNFEQVVGAAPEVADLLESSPRLKVLVTSRVALHLRGEQEYPVPPLALPTSPSATGRALTTEQMLEVPAVALFVERARGHRPDFHLTAAIAPAVAGICGHLDGLPLALELAAAKVKVLPAPALLQRLERRLPLLTGGAHDLLERQQTMRSTLAWSHDLLSSEEQRLFRRLAVFVGGWTLEASEAVCAAPEGAEPLGMGVLEGLGALIDQSLVQQWAEPERAGDEQGGEARYRLLYVIREYALEQLEASGEAAAVRQAHADYYVELAEHVWAAMLAAQDHLEHRPHLERLERDQDNLRVALTWLQARAEEVTETGGEVSSSVERVRTRWSAAASVVQGLRLAGALVWAWANRGRLGEGRAWLEVFLALDAPALALGATEDQHEPEDASATILSGGAMISRPFSTALVRTRALYAVGVLAYWQGDTDGAVPPLERSLALARALGDRQIIAAAVNNLGMAVQAKGDLSRARACYEEGLALGRDLGDATRVADTLLNLSRLSLVAGDLEQAAARSEEALAVCCQVSYHTGAAVGVIVQTVIACRRGDLARAATLAQEALALQQVAMDMRYYGAGIEVCAIVCASEGRAERAARLLGAAAAFRERVGTRQAIEAADIESAVAPARAALGEEAWQAAYAAGQAMTLEEAIAEAQEQQQ